MTWSLMRCARSLLAGVLLAVAASGMALADKRVALVIGNSAYPGAAWLANPANDAADVAAKLTSLGFDVVTGVDLKLDAFDATLARFSAKAIGADVALVYYSGHAMQFDEQNWLMPVDTRVDSLLEAKRYNVSLQDVMREVAGRARITLVFLDACRVNPLAEQLQRQESARGRDFALARGLGAAEVRAPETLLVYATRPNDIAADGRGRNSPFTAAFLAHVTDSGVEIEVMLKLVRAGVEEATGGKQQPESLSKLKSLFYFAPGANPAPAPPAPVGLDAAQAYVLAEKINTPGAWNAFLAQHGSSPYGPYAREALAKLAAAAQQVAAVTTQATPPRPPAADTSGLIREFRGHTDYVRSVAFSPDGRRIVSGSDDKTLRLWDAETGAELSTFTAHTDGVSSVAFSPDGRRIVSGSWDKTLRLWDAETGALLRTFTGHTAPVMSVAFSPDGRRIVSGSGGILYFLGSRDDDYTVRLWDAETGALLRTFTGHTAPVWSVAFSPDGRRIVSASVDKTVRLWDAETGALLRIFTGHTSSVHSVAFSPDGRRIISGSYDKTLRLWDAETGALLRTFTGHTGVVTSVAFSSDGQRIVSGSSDGTLRLWDATAN